MKNKILSYVLFLSFGFMTVQCDSYLDTSSPEKTDDKFVTSTPSETFKILSECYAKYRQDCAMGSYLWQEPMGSDAEYYPEMGSANNATARLQAELHSIDVMKNPFNNLYSVLAIASKTASLIEAKAEYQSAIAAGKVNDWTQLHGEAVTMWAFCYFNLTKHFGDIPFGYESSNPDEFELSSRFDIYDELIKRLGEVESEMYRVGENGITAERFNRTFTDALIGKIALFAGGYQTIRTDVEGLYGDRQFTVKSTDNETKCAYARLTDYTKYYQTAEKYFGLALNDNKGTSRLVTADDRSNASNPFQRHFQYQNDLQLSPEALYEIGSIQGGGNNAINSEYGYAFVRPCDGGQPAAPCKGFGAIRIMPTTYYGDYDNSDKRRDASAVVTGSNGDGNEKILSFTPGNKCNGGIAINKWDDNKMNPPYTAKQRQSGRNWPIMRVGEVMLMQAEVKAELSKEPEALALLNDIRARAFGDDNHRISASGEALKEAVWQERKLELLGEYGARRWDMIRSGHFAEWTMKTRNEMKAMLADLQTKGYHTFANGNTISNFIYTKMVRLDNPLVYDGDINNPAMFPGWRGQYDYATLEEIASKVKGTNHNLAIKGLFNYIDPNGAEAAALEADGYKKTNWAILMYNTVTKEGTFAHSDQVLDHYTTTNFLPGITDVNSVPRYFWPIPAETLNKTIGRPGNGYGLKQPN